MDHSSEVVVDSGRLFASARRRADQLGHHHAKPYRYRATRRGGRFHRESVAEMCLIGSATLMLIRREYCLWPSHSPPPRLLRAWLALCQGADGPRTTVSG